MVTKPPKNFSNQHEMLLQVTIIRWLQLWVILGVKNWNRILLTVVPYCCCCLTLVEGLSSSRVSPTDSLTLQSSMHFYMHVTPLHRGFEPTMPFHTAYPHVLLCGLAWHLGAVVRLSRDNLSYFSVHCTPFYIADFQSARCYKGQPFLPAQLPHGEPA